MKFKGGGRAGGGGVGVGDGWEAKGGQYHPQHSETNGSISCVLSRAQKLPQLTW